MSRQQNSTTLRASVRELEAELAKWKADYRELALAIARRDGYGTGRTPPAFPAIPSGDAPRALEVLAPLPASVLAAIEETTPPFSEARTTAIETARALLNDGVSADDVETQLRQGDEIKV